jgi:hypothetical protein
MENNAMKDSDVSSDSSERRRGLDLPTSNWRSGKPGLLARLTGVLKGAADSSGKYYVWVESAGIKTHVVWPAGFTALLDPLEIVDADGKVVAREGDVIEVGGGAGSAKHALPDELGGSPAFVVHSKPVVLRRLD